MDVIAREPDARCVMCRNVGGAYCDACAAAVFAVHDLWREYERATANLRGAVDLLREVATEPPLDWPAERRTRWMRAVDALLRAGGQ